MSTPAVYYHQLFLAHDTGEHPENKERLVVTVQALMDSGMDLEWITPEPASVEAIARVHDPDYIDSIRVMAERGGGRLDWDTVVSAHSYQAALLAAGSGIMAARDCLATGRPAFILGRPPGHHATPSRGMGFCLFNNIAVAAASALAELGLERVLIVDWDVHHGNGTQTAFYEDPGVLFFSMHLSPHYPGTGLAPEVGAGEGAGFTVNVPLQRGDADGAVHLAFESLLIPVARAYRPQMVLVSAGYDSQKGDVLGGLGFSEAAFQWMAARLRALAQEVGAAGPICFLEGGYVPHMLASSIAATIKGLGGEAPVLDPVASKGEQTDVLNAVKAARIHWQEVL